MSDILSSNLQLMGCGASQNIAEPESRNNPSAKSKRGSVPSDESDSDSDDENDLVPSYSTPLMDKLWRVKVLFFDSAKDDKSITMDVFMQRSNIELREIYRALDIFGKISNSSKLDFDILARRLVWPYPKNDMLARFVYCFDLDLNGVISFKEFIILFSMFSPNVSREEKYRSYFKSLCREVS